jgi:hypothetical protein
MRFYAIRVGELGNICLAYLKNLIEKRTVNIEIQKSKTLCKNAALLR